MMLPIMNGTALTVTNRMRRIFAPLGLAAILAVASGPAHADVDIQEVTSPSGVTAWLVEDDTIPLVSIRFAFAGGATQDPESKEGLANFMSGLMDEGAGDLESLAFQERLDEVGAEMSFSASRDTIYGQMRLMSSMRDEAFDVLRMALNQPRFDEEPVARIRSQILTGIRASERDPQTQGRQAFARALYPDHPYARPNEGTTDSVASIERDDLAEFHERNFARSNLTVAVVGDIDAATLAEELERLFGHLPDEAQQHPVDRIDASLDQEVNYPFALPQATLQLVYPGIERDDPEFFAAYVMNHILGGGVFSSRLFDEVREQRGLSYGIGSSLQNSDYVSNLAIGTSTRVDRTEETLAVIDDVIDGMIEEGPSEQELERAKTYLIGAYPINNLDTSASIARTLVELQRSDLGIDYIDRREDLINAVTLEEVRDAAGRLLDADPAVLVIGPERGETD